MAPSQSVLPRASCQLCDFFEPTNRVRGATRPKFKHMATGDDPSAELPKEVQLSETSLEQIIRGVTERLRQPPATTENPTDGSSGAGKYSDGPYSPDNFLYPPLFYGCENQKTHEEDSSTVSKEVFKPISRLTSLPSPSGIGEIVHHCAGNQQEPTRAIHGSHYRGSSPLPLPHSSSPLPPSHLCFPIPLPTFLFYSLSHLSQTQIRHQHEPEDKLGQGWAAPTNQCSASA